MRNFARWHIWLGWLVGLPILMWMVTGLIMVVKPIEDVRGEHLRVDLPQQVLPAGNPAPLEFSIGNPVQYREKRVIMQNGRPIWLLTTTDGDIERYPADGSDVALPAIDEQYVRSLLAAQIVGGDTLSSLQLMTADAPAADFRRPIPAWQAELAGGERIYVDARTGEIAAIRTPYWRIFDFAWGLHIMDLQGREDSSHPILIIFAGLGSLAALLGCILMFRRRKVRRAA